MAKSQNCRVAERARQKRPKVGIVARRSGEIRAYRAAPVVKQESTTHLGDVAGEGDGIYSALSFAAGYGSRTFHGPLFISQHVRSPLVTTSHRRTRQCTPTLATSRARVRPMVPVPQHTSKSSVRPPHAAHSPASRYSTVAAAVFT
eukprot:723797-Prorocentrum_minimum.AAC.1